MWPQNKSLPLPEYCDLTNASISCHSKIWKHEWRAHGTCSMLPPINYFNLALKLHANNLIKVILGTNGMNSGERKIVDAL
jgi:ribonuclease I